MPVASETSRIQYTGNGSSVTPYGVPLYFLANADIRVVLADAGGMETLLAETTHYTLTGAGNPAGGNLTTVVAYNNTHTLTIYREPEQTQSADFQSTGALPADTLTRGLDKLTMIVQSVSRKVARCFRFNDKAGDVEALSEAARANTVFGFDSSGALILRDKSLLLSLLSLSGSVTGASTAFWADNGERALKVPDFVGQVGVQLDTSAIYRSTGTSAGNWGLLALDEDTMTSDSAVRPPTQQSVKAYVDSRPLDEDDFASDSALRPPSQQSAKAYVDAEPITKTLQVFRPQHNEPPSTNYATLDTRNGHPVLDFDTTTQESAIFSGRIPEGVSLAAGLTVFLQWAASSATTGTIGWDVAFERMADGGVDIDADSFGTARTVTAATVSGASGITKVTSVAFSQAQLPTDLAPGDAFRIRVRRDVANDDAAGDAELLQVEIRLA